MLFGSQARLASPEARSLSATQIVTVVSGRIIRSARRYSAEATPLWAAKAHPCTVKIRIGTPETAAASRPSTPALELFA